MRSEQGQALPMALVALAIGALVVVPFLSHASSSLIGSRLYGDTMAEQSSSDAGVEHAIWSLTRGSLAQQFTGPGDEVTYQLPETVNGLSVNVAVTANATSAGGGTVGEIADAVIDTLDFDSSSGYYPDIIQVSGSIYAIAYQGNRGDGYIGTVSVAADGQIGDTVIDTLEFDPSDCIAPDIINISGSIYAVAYQGNRGSGRVTTVSIAADGQIGNSTIDTLEFDRSGYEPVIVHVSGDVYAIAYRGNRSDGFLATVSIAANGQIGNSVIDSLEFDPGDGFTPHILQVSGNVYAIAYMSTGSDGTVVTVTIADNGAIGNSVIDSFVFDSSAGYEPDFINISGEVYAVAYRGASNGGYLRTLTITSGGDIGAATVDTLVFDTSTGYEPNIAYVASNVYAIAYRGVNNDGFVITVSIAADGQIGDTVIDTLEYDTSNGYYPDIAPVAEGIFAIAFSGPSMYGYLKTIGITTQAATAASWEIVSTAGTATVRAYVDTDNTTATIVSWRLE